MADTKISAMSPASTPLTGAELVPLVQSGVNVKATVANFGQYITNTKANRGAWQSSVTQTGSITAGTAFTFNQTDLNDGITLVSGTQMTVPVSGDYNLQFSGQFQNTDNAPQNATVWVRINGVDLAGSAGVVSLQARKSPAIPASTIVSWNYFLTLTANQYVELVWVPDSTLVTAPAIPASLVAPVHPAAASIIATMNQIG